MVWKYINRWIIKGKYELIENRRHKQNYSTITKWGLLQTKLLNHYTDFDEDYYLYLKQSA